MLLRLISEDMLHHKTQQRTMCLDETRHQCAVFMQGCSSGPAAGSLSSGAASVAARVHAYHPARAAYASIPQAHRVAAVQQGRYEEYPKLKELIARKEALVSAHATPPYYLKVTSEAFTWSLGSVVAEKGPSPTLSCPPSLAANAQHT